jgi:hypothetical protein
MPDFFRFTNVEGKLQQRVNEVLEELDEKNIRDLIKTQYIDGLTLVCCPFCPNRFETVDDLLKHLRQRRWEFRKLTRNIHHYPRYFEYHDLLYKEEFNRGKMYWKLRRWVLCCKLMEKLNPVGLYPLTTDLAKRKSSLYTMALIWLRGKDKR